MKHRGIDLHKSCMVVGIIMTGKFSDSTGNKIKIECRYSCPAPYSFYKCIHREAALRKICPEDGPMDSGTRKCYT